MNVCFYLFVASKSPDTKLCEDVIHTLKMNCILCGKPNEKNKITTNLKNKIINQNIAASPNQIFPTQSDHGHLSTH